VSASITLRGTLEVGGDACVSACATGDRTTKQLALRCGTRVYQSSVETPESLQIQTVGAIGNAFIDLDALDQFIAIELLFARSEAPMILRIGALPARLDGVGATFATVLNAETLLVTIDGVPVVVTFVVPGDTTAAAIAARINAAAALAGLPTPRAEVLASGQLRISGVLTGGAGTVAVTGGTAATKLGYPGTPSAVGAGEDVRIFGSFFAEFDPQAAPARIQVSGTGRLTLLAAGRTV
jgi:hypothetical protein